MEENYYSKITVDDLSKIVNMSTPNFFRYFKKVFNTSPMEYLKKIRISHATAMLSFTDKSISFIAQECGFFDASHFTHAFEQSTNMKPKEFRLKSKTDPNGNWPSSKKNKLHRLISQTQFDIHLEYRFYRLKTLPLIVRRTLVFYTSRLGFASPMPARVFFQLFR